MNIIKQLHKLHCVQHAMNQKYFVITIQNNCTNNRTAYFANEDHVISNFLLLPQR